MLIKIDLSQTAQNFDGVALQDSTGAVTYGKFAATALIFARTDQVIRVHDMAEQFHKTGIVEVSLADADLIKQLVAQSNDLNNMVKGPILKAINAAIRTSEDNKNG